jgi:SAM-dependent methyltransferase
MTDGKITFRDGAGYEEMMGRWSRLVGEEFLVWLAPKDGLLWLDVGCGNGAFTELIVERCAPGAVEAIDPSPAQIEYARNHRGGRGAEFRVGDALHLPYPDGHFDAVVSALVLFFLPDPAQGVREMVRVSKPGGAVSAYVWDFPGGGFPFNPMHDAFRAIGKEPPLPPHHEVSAMTALRALWSDSGLQSIDTHSFTVRRGFPSAQAFWESLTESGASASAVRAFTDEEREKFFEHLYSALPREGPILPSGRANAIVGVVPA